MGHVKARYADDEGDWWDRGDRDDGYVPPTRAQELAEIRAVYGPPVPALDLNDRERCLGCNRHHPLRNGLCDGCRRDLPGW